MRWPAYLILVYLIIGVQIGMADYIRFVGAKPDLILLAVIFVAVNAPRDAALLGAFGIGLITDLVSLSPLGLYAFTYSLVGMFVVSTQEFVYRAHPVTHVSLGLAGGIIAAVVLAIHGWIKGPPPVLTELITSALYTALLAPVVLGLLQLARKAFAFAPRRRMRSF